MDEYHLAEQIGEGSFGKVFKGRRRYTSQIVALKLINKHGKSDKDLRNLRQVPPPPLPSSTVQPACQLSSDVSPVH
jgi:serine/threonine protein kinase